MRPRARRARAMLRYRRRGYGPSHALLCRCPECVDYGPAVIKGLTDYDLYIIQWLRSDKPLQDHERMRWAFEESI